MDICSEPIKSDFKNAESGYGWLHDSCRPCTSAYPLWWKQEDTEKVEKPIWKTFKTLLNQLFYLRHA